MKRVVCIFVILFFTFLTIFIFSNGDNRVPVKRQLADLDLSDINKVMFVAHPDDETIWGGAHLLTDDYLVVCVTCGGNRTRVLEIEKALSYSNDKLVMLGYPDKVLGKRSDWKEYEKSILKDIKEILNYKDWSLVATHNPDGEYGHIHHKMTSLFVTLEYGKRDNLYYFGKYYTKKDIRYVDFKSNISDDVFSRKISMLNFYKSQGFIDDKFGHMYPYERWYLGR